MTTKSQLYSEAKRRGLIVKWIGTTKKELQDQLALSELPNVIEEIPKSKKTTKNEMVMIYSRFQITYEDDRYPTYYSEKFRVKRNNVDRTIKEYINRKKREYKVQDIIEIDRKVFSLDTNDTEDNILNRPLRQTGTYDITNYVKNNTWNYTRDECVIDYILSRLYDNNYDKKEIIRRNLGNILFNEIDGSIITANNIIEWAKKLNVNIYITHFNKLIYKEINNAGHKHKKVLCFEIRNNHVYPINDRAIINKLQKEGNPNYKKDITHHTRNNIIFHPTNKEDGINFLFEKIKETNMQPFGNISMKDGRINSFILDDTLYVCHKEDESMKSYCNNKQIQYTGQSIQVFIKNYLKEVPISFMNYEVLTALNCCMVKNRSHIGNPYKRVTLPDDVKIDINRCFSSCLKMPFDEFMIIEFDTIPIKINSLIGLGLYYVKTNDMTLLHGSNWYSNKIISIALEQKIPLTIKAYIRGTKSNFTFDTLINTIEKEFPLNSKLALNSLIGYFAQTKKSTSNIKISTDWNDVLACIKKKNPIVIEQDDLYLYGNETIYNLHKNYLPMWIQLLDWSNIRLHNLIMEHGGYDNLVYRKTDMAIMRNTKVNISNIWGGYKLEEKEIIQQTYTLKREASLCLPSCNVKMIKHSDINNHINSGKSLLIIGRAGTGKSYIINEFSKNNKTIRLAYTNKAANNINGTTLHKFFKLDNNDGINMQKSIKDVKAIFIDEISMIPSYIWSLIIDLKNQCNVPIILVGDDRQLPPINELSHFNNPSIKWLTDFYKVELIEMQRYDSSLWDYLENPYQLQESLFDSTAMHICYTNKCVDRINSLMNWIHVPNPTIIIDDIRLKKGVPIISLHNTRPKRNDMGYMHLIKNEHYIIDDITNTHIFVKSSSYIEPIAIDNFTKLFTLGYAMTTHKMQGSTVYGSLQIHEIDINSDRRLFYTAYSRATKLNNITYCSY